MPPRFRWVAFIDPLLFPLNTSLERTATPDVRSLYPHEERILGRYLAALHLKVVPPTLDAYLSTVVGPTLDRVKRDGAVAIKYEVAYLRGLDFGNPSRAAAAAVYARPCRRGHPDARRVQGVLEDFLFREIGRQAGTRGLAVHIHSADIAGGFYNVTGSQPLLLEGVFNDLDPPGAPGRYFPRRLAANTPDPVDASKARTRVRRFPR